jgi:uncharacterized Zn-binding protein involved in type VI secretion
MPAVARVTQDRTGDIIIGNLAPSVKVNGKPIAVEGAAVTPYKPFTGCFAAPKLGPGSKSVNAEGKSVCRQGDKDICGTPIIKGSDNVNAG